MVRLDWACFRALVYGRWALLGAFWELLLVDLWLLNLLKRVPKIHKIDGFLMSLIHDEDRFQVF
jgi:hypothetical protein